MRRVYRASIALLMLLALIAGFAPTASANWGVFVGVLPARMHADEPHAELLVKSHIGAVCRAAVTYDGVRQKPTIFPSLTIKSKNPSVWKWHNQTRAKRAEATIRCIYQRVTLTSVAYITIVS